MNIFCQEGEKLKRAMYEAQAKSQKAAPGSTIPLEQNITKEPISNFLIEQRKLEQEFSKTKEEYELHKKSCHSCIISKT